MCQNIPKDGCKFHQIGVYLPKVMVTFSDVIKIALVNNNIMLFGVSFLSEDIAGSRIFLDCIPLR